MRIQFLFVFFFVLALCICTFCSPNGQKKAKKDEKDMEKEVEQMRKKLEAWDFSKTVEQKRNNDDDSYTDQPADHQHLALTTVDQPASKKEPSEFHEQDKHVEASGRITRRKSISDQQNYEQKRKSEKELRKSRTDLHRNRRRNSTDLVRNLDEASAQVPIRCPKPKQLSASPGDRRNKSIVSYESKKPPSPGNRRNSQTVPHDSKKPQSPSDRNKQIVPYQQKMVVCKRKEKTLDDMQQMRNEMCAVLSAYNAEQDKARHQAEAQAMQELAFNRHASQQSAIRPIIKDGLLSRLTRKIKPEPEKWKRNLAKTFSGKPIRKAIDYDRGYHGYFHEDDPYADPDNYDRTACIDPPQQTVADPQRGNNNTTMLGIFADTHQQIGNESHTSNIVADQPLSMAHDHGTSSSSSSPEGRDQIHEALSSSESEFFVPMPAESDTDRERESSSRSPSPLSRRRHNLTDQQQRISSFRRPQSDRHGNSGGIGGSARTRSVGYRRLLSDGGLRHESVEENIGPSIDEGLTRILSRRSTFHGHATLSDQFEAIGKEPHGVPRWFDIWKAKDVDENEMPEDEGMDHQDQKTFSLAMEDLDEEDEKTRLALQQSLEQAESIKRQDEEQIRVAMEHSMMDEIQRRKNKKTSNSSNPMKKLIQWPEKKSNKFDRPTSSAEPHHQTTSSDDDPVLQKAIRNSLKDLR